MIEQVEVLNLETGDRGTIRRDWFENPVINAGILVEVHPDQKPYVPELYKSKVEHEDILLFEDEYPAHETPVFEALASEEEED